MAIIEIREMEYVHTSVRRLGKEAIYIYTGFCGTCRLGERMLEIIDTMDSHIPISKMNINYCPTLRDLWRISSVPCLVILVNGKPEQFIYAMRSVDYLYEILKT